MGIKRSEHTKLGWYIGIIAVFVEITLGLTYVFRIEEQDRIFGTITLIEGTLAFTGLIFMDIFYGGSFDLKHLKPDLFKPLDKYKTFKKMVITFGGIILVQVFLQFPLTVREFDRALAVWFAAPSEELFFRGLLLAPFISQANENNRTSSLLNKRYSIGLNKRNVIISISLIEIIGITASSIAFMGLHYNYYEDYKLLLMVFFSGIVLGIAYIWHKNLLANILAHLLLNLIVTVQVFASLNF